MTNIQGDSSLRGFQLTSARIINTTLLPAVNVPERVKSEVSRLPLEDRVTLADTLCPETVVVSISADVKTPSEPAPLITRTSPVT